MHQKRGQVAMEFLMTYGWAIIIILLAVAALWLLGVFSPSVTTTCQIEAPFTCQDAVISDNSIIINLGTAQTQSATVTSITVNGQACPTIINSALTPNTVTTVKCLGLTLKEKEKTAIQITTSYKKKGGGLTHSAEGTISGQASRGSYVYDNDPDLLLAYDFDGGPIDLTGNGYSATLTGGVDCTVQGKRGNACSFNGTDLNYYQISPVSPELPASNFAFSFWFYLDNDAVSRGVWQYLLHPSGFRLYQHDGDNQLYFYNTGAQLIGWAPSSGEWHHLACSVIADDNVICYGDGQKKAINQPTGGFTSSSQITLTTTSSGGNDLPMDGKLDELAIYTRVLTDEEMIEHSKL
ncbi:hypothetical protein CL622_05300 [archaeon]|nr:hypothetical protein [archaeon]